MSASSQRRKRKLAQKHAEHVPEHIRTLRPDPAPSQDFTTAKLARDACTRAFLSSRPNEDLYLTHPRFAYLDDPAELRVYDKALSVVGGDYRQDYTVTVRGRPALLGFDWGD